MAARQACSVDGPAHSKVCRDRFEEIFKKETEDLAVKMASEAAAQSAEVQKEAAAAAPPPLAAPTPAAPEQPEVKPDVQMKVAAPSPGSGPDVQMRSVDLPPGSMPGSSKGADPVQRRRSIKKNLAQRSGHLSRMR